MEKTGYWKTECKTCHHTRAKNDGIPITSKMFGIMLAKLLWSVNEKGDVCPFCRGILT